MMSQCGKFLLNLGSNVLLTRLLTPEDYGLVGMVTAITGFITLFKDLGLSAATIQRDEINHEQVSVLFWVNTALSIVTMLVTIAIAPAIASFYGEPRLIGIAIALSCGFLMSGLGIQHYALLNRQMRFTTLIAIDLFSTTIGIIAAIIAALLGAEYWAIVCLTLFSAGTNTLAAWVACGWRPQLPRTRSGVRSILAFGGNLTGFNFLSYFARNADNMLIGKVWGAQQLGLYAKAYQLLVLPLSQVNAPITRVAIPALSRLHQEPEKFRRHYLKALSMISFVTLPAIVFFLVTTEETITLVLGSQWIEAVPIARVLSVAALVQPICNTAEWLYTATGRTDRMFKWGLVFSPCIVLSFIIGLPHGAQGVAISYAVAMLLQAIPCLYFATKNTSIRLYDIWIAVSPALISAAVAGLSCVCITRAMHSSLLLWQLEFLNALSMSLLYLLFVFYVFKQKDFYLSVLSGLRKR